MDQPEKKPGEPEKKPRLRTDIYIWGIYAVLIIISILELYSASSQEVRADNVSAPLMRHMQFLVIGLFIMVILQHFHYKWIYWFTPLYVAGSIAVMVLVLFVGTKINGAQRGLSVGPITLLPAEMIKLAVALGVAWLVTRFQIKGTHDITDRGVKICCGFVLLCAALLIPHGLTNTLIVMAIALTMMGVGFGGRKFWLFIAFAGIVGGAYVGYKILAPSDVVVTPRMERIAELNKESIEEVSGKGRGVTWGNRLKRHFRLNKYTDTICDDNKQEMLSYKAQAHGGMTGVGIGRSRENSRLPLAFSDYIYAIIIEEMGLFVGIFVLVLYLWLMLRAGQLALSFKSTLPSLLVIGCSLVVVYQGLAHMCVVSGVIPVSGQPLPLISKGGTSILVTSMALGVMLSVSRHAARKNDADEIVQTDQENLPDQAQKSNPVQI